MVAKMTYEEAGVSIEKGDRFVQEIKGIIKSLPQKNIIGDIGAFGGLFSLKNFSNLKDPVLVSSTDGVGTKVKVASMMKNHKTIGIDLVAMCANDIVVQGAQPLFLLDYLAFGKLSISLAKDIITGIKDGCLEAGCALLGGETAEMPSVYKEDDYDMAAFVVGIVDKKKIIDGSNIKDGDVIIGIKSNGVHSNGYSLARAVCFEKLNLDIQDYVDELQDTIGNILLAPTKIYVKPILSLIEKFNIKGLAHITGGGLPGNIPRILPSNVSCVIERGTWQVPKIFSFLQNKGNIETKEMFKTFNMGIGMVVIVAKEDKDEVMGKIESSGETAYQIGYIAQKKKKNHNSFELI